MSAILNAMVPWFANAYLGPGAPRSITNITEAAAQTLTLSEFTIAAQVIAFAADRPAIRHINTCKGDNFNKVSFFRFDGVTGQLAAFYRTPLSQMAMQTATALDDGFWHNVAFVRDPSGTPTFRMYIDGVQVLTNTANPGTTVGTTFSAWGNFEAAGVSPGPDEPLVGGRLASSYIIDSAMTTVQVDDLLDNGVVPAGMTILNRITFPDTDNSSRVVPEIGPV